MAYCEIGGVILVVVLIFILLCSSPQYDPPKIKHTGLELMANKGRIVYVRETESERDLF